MPTVRPEALTAPWGEHELPPGEVRSVTLGPLTLRLLRKQQEIWVAEERAPLHGESGGDGEETEPPGDPDWARWPMSEGVDRLFLAPAFPDRPVVVEPELSFRLIRGEEARIYVRVPLQVRILLPGGPEEAQLMETPTIVLSDTWWGGFTEGELCYWLPTTARRSMESDLFQPHLAVCPLHLANRSEGDLHVEKIALRVVHLSIFADEGHFWADETRARYRGEAEGSDIRMSGDPPPDASEAELVAAPRIPEERGFSARTFARLRTLSGLGGGV